MSHTPEPWEYTECLGARLSSISGSGVVVAGIPNPCSGIKEIDQADLETNRANARLIIAAPEMLEALRECLTTMLSEHDGRDVGTKWDREIRMARAVIAKAEGTIR